MNIIRARQISQGFFFVLFLWFCIVASLGEKWWQLRGWPVNLFLELDPLVALGTVMTTGTLYAGLLWALATIVLTVLLGRFFCGWICPFGALHHVIGFLANRKQSVAKKASKNRYRRAQSIKYVVLVFLLGAAAGDVIGRPGGLSIDRSSPPGFFLALLLLVLLVLCLGRVFLKARRLSWPAFVLAALVLFVGLFAGHDLVVSSLQTGLLDPIALMTRSVNLVVLPLLHGTAPWFATGTRHAVGAWLLGTVFLTAVLLNLIVPRFYCRFVCPLGALFGILGRFSLWRIAKTKSECSQCLRCEAHCEGACVPSGQIRISECVLCMNCLHSCDDNLITYRPMPSESGEIFSPDLSRRHVMLSFFSGMVAVPVMRLGNVVGENWSPHVVRPPGALSEKDFLNRCVKCGQCMRICPTNIIHPAGFQAGLEGLWTPVLNFRIGTSGCQYNCIACGQFCPTAAIRPLTLEEKHGTEDFAAAGPIRLGTAFVDRGRCLPWAMDKPCIVCEENCPVSPKAIFTRKDFMPLRGGPLGTHQIQHMDGRIEITLREAALEPNALATGDYYLRLAGRDDGQRYRILENTANTLTCDPGRTGIRQTGTLVEIEIQLKRPFVDVQRCIGCGICEHECPVRGLRAIRVTAENESRNREHALLLQRGGS